MQKNLFRPDDRDRKILKELGEDAWLTYCELGRRVHMSASAVQRRVERLRSEKILLGARAQISPGAIRRPLYIVMLIELHEEGRDLLERMAQRIRAEPVVKEAHYMAGEVDVLVVTQVSAMEEHFDFVSRVISTDPNVKRVRTLTSMRSVKS